MGLEDRVCGGLVGLALGEAVGLPLARLSPEEVARRPLLAGSLVHGAGTTWALAVVDALVDRRRGEGLEADLALKLQILARPCRGAALRGGPETAAGTLSQVARALEEGDPALAGIDEPRGDGLLGPFPLLFALGDDERDLARAVAVVVGLTHRHPEVCAAAGLLVGGLRRGLGRSRATGPETLAELLDAGTRFSALCLDALIAARPGGLSAGRSAAEGAVAMASASARSANDLEEICPRGLDARDAPARLAAAALWMASRPASGALAVLEARARAGGDADVLLPLLAAALGARLGASRLPLGWLERLATRKLVLTRARLLMGGPRPRVLVEEEIRVSRRWAADEPVDLEGEGERDQLPLL